MKHNDSIPSSVAKFLLVIFTFLLIFDLTAQTCPNGSLSAVIGYGVSASGGTSGASNATGTILASGSTLNGSNSAVSSTSTALVIDMQRWIAQGSTFTVAWSKSSGTPTGTVQVSNDNSTYSSLGTLSGASNANSVYKTFTVPSGGFRYVKILATAGSFFIDGVKCTHSCYYAARTVNDTRVVLSPGTAKGNIAYNDLDYDYDDKTYSLYTGVSNGTLTFNSTGNFTYIPNIGFDGVDQFTYVLTDAGPDGNISTTGDNSNDTARVTFRTLFNCDSTQFFLPVPENEGLDFLQDISPSFSNADPTEVYIGLSVATDAIVIYDHWEDGFEADIKAPAQSTTQIWGDGDLSNGVAPGFPTDILDAGQAIILNNTLTSGHSGLSSYNPNASGSDATLQATVDYDGKDKVFVGGIAAMTKLIWGSLGTPSVCGGAIPPVRKWGTSYVLPVGINTANSGTSFQVTSLSIQASQSGTTISIDRDANGTVDITTSLTQGETYYLDSKFNGSTITVNQGATITSNKPIMVTLMTGQYNTSPYQSRTFALTPNSQLSTCYYMPGVPQETMRVFLYNPNASSITVTRTTAGGSTTNITVPSKSTNFNDVNTSGLGYKYCSSSTFSIIATVDYNSGTSDWGFVPVPTSNLTTKVLVSYGDGEDPTSGSLGTDNYEQAMVTADCNTYLYVDLNGDQVPDKVSFNADVDASDASVSIGSVNYNETTSNNGILLQAYQTLTVGSTTGSLNGAVFWTKTAANNTGSPGCNIVLVWGQNGGPSTTPNIDAGYTVPNIATDINNQVVKSSDSIIVGLSSDSIKLIYSDAVMPYKVFWFNESTNTYSVFSTSTDSFVILHLEPGNYLIKLKDANCRNFTQRVKIIEIPSAKVNGKIYHDANGQANGSIDGTGISTAGGSQLYMYLAKTNNTVFDSAKVQPDGSFSLIGRQVWRYTLKMSTTAATFGNTVPTLSLPSYWVNTAEQYGTSNGNGSGVESGTANGAINIGLSTSAINSANFSLEKYPAAHNKTYGISPDSVMHKNSGISKFPYYIRLDNASGTADTTVTGSASTIMPGKLSGYDAEDGRFNSSSSSAKLVLTQLPDSATNGVLVYNGIQLHNNPIVATPAYAYWNASASRYEISSFNPSLLRLYVKSVYQTNTQFKYSYLDNANILGQEATYRINYLSPLPMRVVFNGEMNGNNAYLEWKCYNKQDVAYFQIERTYGSEFVPRVVASIDDDGHDQYSLIDNLEESPDGLYSYTLYSVSHSGVRRAEGNITLEKGHSAIAQTHISPNPASGDISLNLSGYDERTVKTVTIFSASGQLVYTYTFTGNSAQVNTESLAEGMYVVRISDLKSSTSTSVLINR